MTTPVVHLTHDQDGAMALDGPGGESHAGPESLSVPSDTA
jgi:hypothetical protein